MLGASYSAHAGTFYCSTYGGVIDGNDPATFAYISTTNNTLGIDTNCTIQNWPVDNGIGGFPITNINFYFPGGAQYYIVFDNVYYPGNMSCNSPQNSDFWIYWAPGSFNKISDSCQQFMVPVDMVIKTNPPAQTTATIGIPFTYTITAPKLGAWDVKTNTFAEIYPYDNKAEIQNLVIVDDLSLTGAAVSYVTNKAYLVDVMNGTRTLLNGGNPLTPGASATWLAAHPEVPASATVFSYEFNNDLKSVPPFYRVDIELTVVLDNNTAINTPGTQFTNSAEMWFDKVISYTKPDGTTGYTPMTDLHAWPSTTEPMTIVAPDFVVTKSTPSTAVNLSNTITYTIDAQNTGGWDAWSVKLEDLLPKNTVPSSSPAKGMCETDPTTFGTGLSARILNADGTENRVLTGGVDYTLAPWTTTGPNACKITLTLTDSGGAIAPNQTLQVVYQTKIDTAFSGGGAGDLINVAGTTHWFNADSTAASRNEYLGGGTGVLTDGSPAVDDFQDNASVTVAVSGYYFEKTVANLATGADPATTAAPGDTLNYRLHLFNVDQTISNISISDPLDAASFVLPLAPADIVTCSVVGTAAVTVNPVCTFDSLTNTLNVSGAGGAPLDLPQGDDLVIEFNVTLKSTGLGTSVSNQAQLYASGITSVTPAPASYPSDDPYTTHAPYTNVVSNPDILGDEDPTVVTIVTPGPLAKSNPAKLTAAIGEQFTYTITVPAVPVDVPLYDVHVLDDLGASTADLRFVGARWNNGSSWINLSNMGSSTSLDLVDVATGIDIPANTQVQIELTVELQNTTTNNDGLKFKNSASYTYSRTNGSTAPQLNGGAGGTLEMSVVEPAVITATKSVAFFNPAGKTGPAAVGDELIYTVTVPNSGSSTANDVSIVDTLPPNVALVAGSATATIGGVTVTGFIKDPTELSPGVLAWGQLNNDGSLDIPANSGQPLVLTYRVTVVSVNGQPFTNKVHVEWSSLPGEQAAERNGDGCPAFTAPDDYCFVPTPATVDSADTSTIAKSVVSDSWNSDGSTDSDKILRVGDTVVYRLELTLREGLLQSVVVSDTLPTGLLFDGVVSINGDTTAAYSQGGVFSYTDIPAANVPAAGQGGTVNWKLGDITNLIDNDPSNNTLVIEYRVRVATNTLSHTATTSLSNSATLSYTGSAAGITSSASVEVRQPVIPSITKSDRLGRVGTAATPLNVNVVSDVMQFRLEACNDSGSTAPAYSLLLSDDLPPELNEASLVLQSVAIGGVAVPAAGYVYTAPATRGGVMTVRINGPVNPGQCATVDYDIGFHTDIAPNQTWNNSATVGEYWSLPAANGQKYQPVGPDAFYMTNTTTIAVPLKSIVSPASEATIGDLVTYRITVPGTPVNAALNGVVITDVLNSALLYDGASATLNGVSVSPFSTVQSGQTLTWNIATIPAGQQAVITVTARVANSLTTNAGNTFTNTAAFTYSGAAQSWSSLPTTPLTIVEPNVTVTKSVSPTTGITAGDTLSYTVNLAATSGANYSSAYDLVLVDTLGSGLQYVTGSSKVGGVAVADPAIAGQTLTWPARDIAEGATVVVTYDVRVLDSVAIGQSLSNAVTARWTSQSGTNAYERTGSGTPSYNDYFKSASTTVQVQDTTALAKVRLSDSWNPADANVRIGDTVDFELRLALQEGTHTGVVVNDTLPTGLAYDSLVSITPASGSNFTYTVGSQPAANATGAISWNLGTVVNAADGVTTNDELVIVYRVRVLNNDMLVQTPSLTLNNSATLSYTAGATTLTTPPASASVTVLQPVMTTPTKTATGFTSPALVNVASDVMQFHLESCNTTGLAPAYDITLIDQLATQLDEGSITSPQVRVGGTLLSAGSGYTYTPPAGRGGTMTFVLTTPVNPGQCVTVDYSIGFYTDFGPNQTWTNSITVDSYWSLPLPTTSGESYGPHGPTAFTMTNSASIALPIKTLFAPASGEATIGEEVVYRIAVPGTPTNAALYDVKITDTLNGALTYVGASEVSGNGFTLTDTSVAPGQVNLAIAQIPAGQQAIIELRARVTNNSTANAGVGVLNSVAYSYAESAGGPVIAGGSDTTDTPLTIVEPSVTVAKSVNPSTGITAGTILTYTVNLTAQSGATLSGAFDTVLVDILSLGLEYVAGSAQVGGSAIEPSWSGDGVTTAQTLTWNAGINIPEGTTVAVTYNVRVLDGVTIGQSLANAVTARWTSLDGASSYERTGAQDVAWNDYVATTSTAVMVQDTTTFTKTRTSDTFNAADSNVRVGDFIDYELRLGLQEGTHNGVVVTDTLPVGLVFDSVVSIDLFGTAGTANPTVNGQTLTWNLGTVMNSADGNPANDYLVIVYRARVMNNDTLTQTPTTQSLSNSATLSYSVGTTTVTMPLVSASVAVQQPLLTVTKSAVPAGGDNVIGAGELITYTIDIANSGDAPAYDAMLTDTLPAGLRGAGVTTTEIRLVNAGTVLPPLLSPYFSYSSTTGIATWNFDNGTANSYTIPAGEILRVVYTVQADATLGAGMTLTNAATASLYYSFDDEAVPPTGNASQREVYGPSNTATATLTTLMPGALLKENTQATATIGEQFTYHITVPEVPVSTALHDVRILDDLSLSSAKLRFVSATVVSGGSWTLSNTGTDTNLVIEDTVTGIDIPANGQAVIAITVEVVDDPVNVAGLSFTNTADYTYNRLPNDLASQALGLPGTTAAMTIVEPHTLTLEKSGPVTMRVGLPANFTLNVQNTGSSRAWDVNITDLLPNPTPGGMCSTAPAIVSARIFAADGITPVSVPLVAGTDYTTSFVTGTPDCTWTFTGLSAAAALEPTQRLILVYSTQLDVDNPPGITLTNVAGATQWFSQDTNGAGATGETRTYTRTLHDAATAAATLDHEDAHSVTTEAPTLVVQKTVSNVTTPASGSNAKPGERLRYTITVTNISDVSVPAFSLLDDLGALNGSAVFVSGSLALDNATVPAGADSSATNPNGGTNGAGLVDIRDLSLGAQGTPTASVTIAFEVTLVPVITSGTIVLNQGHLSAYGFPLANTDDPTVNGTDDPSVLGDEDPTQTLISSAPLMQVTKISTDVNGAPLMAGETLRYTITVKNIGSENATGVTLRDLIPAFTTYVPNSTTLNGVAVADPSAGVSALNGGMTINAPADSTPGAMPADASATNTGNVATITFDVVINSNVLNGTIVSNQGYVNGSGAGTSGPITQTPSDDPTTTTLNDPTRNIVGNLPLLDATKTVTLIDNNGSTPGSVDAGDTLRYTITVNNLGAIPASGVTLTDPIPSNTTYSGGTTALNGVTVPDPSAGISALEGGLLIGNLAAGANAVVVFDVTVNSGLTSGIQISNQGFVTSSELPTEPTDADGDDSNGDQPTIITVGSAQQLSIVKQVIDLNGGLVLPGETLEYVVTVTNDGTVDATNVVISDDLSLVPLTDQVSYLDNTATLNGATSGVTYDGVTKQLSADYGTSYGVLPVGGSATLRFRVQVAAGLTEGTTITNIAQVAWSALPTLTAESSVSVDVGGIPGTAMLNGQVWHDVNFDNLPDGETSLAGWSVSLWRNNTQLGSTTTDSNGLYQFSGLAPSVTAADQYELRFSAPGAGLTTASLGHGHSDFSATAPSSVDGPQRISSINATSGANLQNLNLPIDPNGVVYDSLRRTPIAGATLVMTTAGSTVPLPSSCFDDNQQGQVTLASGFYKFDLKLGDPACTALAGGDYVIRVTPPATGYEPGVSSNIPPVTDETTAAFSVPGCPGTIDDAVGAPAGYCEAQPSAAAPGASVPARTAGTNYYLHLTLNTPVPQASQIFNNHIPLDPTLQSVLTISKTSALVNVSRAQLVPYTITVNNSLGVDLANINLVDTFPPGFKYVAGSARVDGKPLEPVMSSRQLSWNGLQLIDGKPLVVKLLFIVGSGVGEGEYVNHAQLINNLTGRPASGDASATVRVIPDPTFDCTDVIGKVFDDANRNGYQDKGEKGLPGVRLATARGLLVKTDKHGRYHITCAVVPDEDRGSNFIIKVDERTLPSGYRVTTENPLVLRATRGKMVKFNFGATIHKVVRLDMSNGVFEPGKTTLRIQWQSRLDLLMSELKKGPSVLRLAYMAEIEDEGLVAARLRAVKEEIARRWTEQQGGYELEIETEVFWRTGAPPDRSRLK